MDKNKLNKIKGLLTPQGAASGGAGAVGGLLQGGGLGKFGLALASKAAFIVPIIGAVLAAPALYVGIMKTLSVKGGPFNRDFRRYIHAEVNVGLTRKEQYEKELGKVQTILTQTSGFHPHNENWTYNSLYEVNARRLARAGLDDRAAGVYSRTVI